MNKIAFLALAAGAAFLPAAASAQVVVQPHPGMSSHGRVVFHGGMFPHQLHPGFIVPPMWFGPQFHVANWQMYGFPAPPPRHRWVRYYDDAYLIDHGGRIRDARRGMDWDRYGERWEMEEGIPHYYGRGDFHPGPDDYAWVERHRGRFDEDDDPYADDEDYAAYGGGCAPACGPGHGPPGPPRYGPPVGYGPPPGYGPPAACHPGPQPCGGYGAGYGYGVIAYPIVIETTVVSGGCNCYEEVVEEEVVEVRQRARVHPRPRPRPRRVAPPPPPPGERG